MTLTTRLTRTIERERLWLLAWWRWCCGHRGCVLCHLYRHRKWQELDMMILGDIT